MDLKNLWLDVYHAEEIAKALKRNQCDKAEIVTIAHFDVDATDDKNITENGEFFSVVRRLNTKAFSATRDLLKGHPFFAVDFTDKNGVQYCLTVAQRGLCKDILLVELLNSADFSDYGEESADDFD